MIGERLKRARAAAGFSMQALAERVGVSAPMIKKYEDDRSMPSSGKLLAIAKALGVRSEYFFRPTVVELKEVEYRKRASTPKSILKRIEADVLDQAERWQELANLWPTFPVPGFALPCCLPDRIGSLEQVDNLADSLRREWHLGLNPIPDLIDTLESHGILVILTDADPKATFDGLQATVAGQPIVVVSKAWSGDRQRFTLAHELGHLLLHGRLEDKVDEERVCNRFAGAFLLPASTMREQLGASRHNIEPRELYLLKQEYGLSMQACLYRAKDLGIISPTLHRTLSIAFSRKGWKREEPGTPYPQESTLLFQQLVYRALAESLITESKAAELLGLPLARFHQTRRLELQHEAADQ